MTIPHASSQGAVPQQQEERRPPSPPGRGAPQKQAEILCGDVRERLRGLAAGSVHCVVTSPPYWGLRDYNAPGQLGLEPTIEEFIAHMVEVFREVRRVLRDDGTLWLNMGDCYAGGGRGGNPDESPFRKQATNTGSVTGAAKDPGRVPAGLKAKDLVGQPWRLAFALQADGWWLRSDIIWSKPNPMPSSVTDRPTTSHEYVFLLTKRARYFYDADAVREKQISLDTAGGFPGGVSALGYQGRDKDGIARTSFAMKHRTWNPAGRNRRTVWEIATAPFPEAHFATYSPKLVEPCIMAGTSERGVCAECGAPWERVVEREPILHRPNSSSVRGSNASAWRSLGGPQQGARSVSVSTTGWRPTCECKEHQARDDGTEYVYDASTVPATVLDPFSGAATTGLVALTLGRRYIGIELNPEYVAMSRKRLAPLLAQPDMVNIAMGGGAEKH